MSDLHTRLRAEPVPGEADAGERAWAVVRAAYDARVPLPRRRPVGRLALALAAALALVAGALSTPGRAFLSSVQDRVAGEKHAAPALFALPSGGSLLVNSAVGAWIVHRDGSKRLLGDWKDASWSPHGWYVSASRGHELVALDPHGDVRWSLARRGSVRGARWSPDGYRIAYLSGSTLRLVIGNGLDDHVLVPRVRPVAPAWRPARGHVLAYVGARGAVNVIGADTGRKLASWREGSPLELTWSPDGRYLTARSSGLVSVYTADGIRVTGISTRSLGTVPGSTPSLAFAPRGDTFALVTRDLDRNRSSVYVETLGGTSAQERRVFTGAGRFGGVRWSPDGRWLLVAWRDADQWLFIRSAGVERIVAVSDVSRQFGGTFPELAGWCCS